MNNKVWLVIATDRYDSYVFYIASTEDLAYEYKDNHSSLDYEYLHGLSVHECIVDSPYEPEHKEEEDG